MQIPPLPLIAPTATTTLVLCDSHYEEVPATREIHYLVAPGGRDEHGSTLAICDDEHCEAKARRYIEHVGDVIEIVPIAAPVEAAPPVGPLWRPAYPSAVTFAGTCTHVAPDSCPDCDGTYPSTLSVPLVEAIPPCMQGDQPAA